jgi:hypothetical protein
MVWQNGCATGPVSTCGNKANSLASTGFRTPNTPASSGFLYRLCYPGPILELRTSEFLGSLPKQTRKHVLNGIMKMPPATSEQETVTRVSRKDGKEKWRMRSELCRTFREHLSMQIWGSQNGQWFRASAIGRHVDWQVVTDVSDSLLSPTSGSELISTVEGLLCLYWNFHSVRQSRLRFSIWPLEIIKPSRYTQTHLKWSLVFF